MLFLPIRFKTAPHPSAVQNQDHSLSRLMPFLICQFVLFTVLIFASLSVANAQTAHQANSQISSDKEYADKSMADIWVIDIQEAIGPATSDWVIRSLEQAIDAKASLFILRMDTPGGLDKSMRDIIQSILSSPVPVAVYVYPKGGRAASAGTYILYAAHIAAMAPATNVGAATPVQMGAPSLPSQPKQPPPQKNTSPKNTDNNETNKSTASSSDESESPSPKTTMERKIMNDAVAYLQSLATLRKRNKEWVVKAVRSSESLEADQALQKNVIDYIAQDTKDLIRQLHQKKIEVSGNYLTLQLQPHRLTQPQPDWRSQFLRVITDPSIAYILLMVGIYGLFLEFYNPGTGVPGILGSICLIVALYALQLLPISYSGLGLIVLGLALMAAEAFSPSVGVLGLGGIIAFVVGSILLMDTEFPAFQIGLPVIITLALISALALAAVMNMALRSRKQAIVSGVQILVGSTAEAIDSIDKQGHVLAQGEIWQAHSNYPISKGQRVEIVSVNGLFLEVKARDKS